MDKNKFFETFKKPKSDIKYVEDLISEFGSKTTLEEVLIQLIENSPYVHLPYKCPKCHGNGYLVREYNGYPSGLPDSGWVYKPAYDYTVCDVCKGMGWTEKELKPIIETKITGYE